VGAGGLGHIGIQALRSLSQAEIIVVDRSAEALEHARGWGADQVVQAKADGSHVQEVKGITGVNDALHALDEGRMIGRGVLVPNES
jgi:NAD+-dependent secondary alcohol dehydrogenase Adh1